MLNVVQKTGCETYEYTTVQYRSVLENRVAGKL